MPIFIIIIISGIILDQLTKFWASHVLSGMTTYPIIPNVLHFTYVENTGAAFNMFSDMQMFLIIITLVFIVLLGYLFYLLPKTRSYNIANLALALMLSGAVGNLIDRIVSSYVIDFIDFRIFNFAVFNIADSMVVVGAFLLLYAYIKNQLIMPQRHVKPSEKAEVQETPESKVEEAQPIKKDVLKDLKPKKVRRNIKPEIKTEIVHLKSKTIPNLSKPEYNITPDFTYQDNTDFFSDYSSIIEDFESRGTQSSSEVIINKENRYSQLSDHYIESIQKIKEEDEDYDQTEPKENRFTKTIDDYEARINSLREESSPEIKEKVLWQPEISNTRPTVKTYDINWNPEFSEIAQQAKSRFQDQINHYAESIKQNSLDNSSEEEIEEPVIIETVQEELTEPVENVEESKPRRNKNRYQDLTDHYIESIKAAKEKSYVKKS